MKTTKVHLIFKTHLDIGFTDFAERVTQRYFTEFIPKAIQTAQELRQAGGSEQFIWTTGSWLIYEYLEQATTAERKQMEAAIQVGDITWHALPFTMHSELMDAALFEFGLSLSQTLDRRFGHQTIAAKMTDVPGHTRGIVPLLAAAGVRFLHIGVNPASAVPRVPPVFRWHDPSGAEVIVMVQGTYGKAATVKGMPEALVFAHTDDNLGPQTASQVLNAFTVAQEEFPAATVVASTLDNFARALFSIESTLPVITQEIGDTWIHGTGSDPVKVGRYRELLRQRNEWLAQGKLTAGDRYDNAFTRKLLLVPEHTWGLDIKTHLADRVHYSNKRFQAVRDQPNFLKMEESWKEQRTYLDQALDALGNPPLASEAHRRLEALTPERPELDGWEKVSLNRQNIELTHYRVGFQSALGCLVELTERHTGHAWSFVDHPIGLLGYQTFSTADYRRFWRQYIRKSLKTVIWAQEDYLKPGLETARAESRWWGPGSLECFRSGERFTILRTFELTATQNYGCPGLFSMEWDFSQPSAISLVLQWFDKPACRLPEALWLSFMPRLSKEATWSMDKLGEAVSPLDVVPNGNRHLHAVGDGGVTCEDSERRFQIISLDAPLVAPGRPSLLDFNNDLPNLQHGMHFNLFNNVWGTNFPMWFGEDCRFRFIIRTQ
jgi:Domain of unknown function (DUF5054)